MAQVRQAHRNRVDEDNFVSRARELPHEVGLGMRVVIPPVFAAKADYRTIAQQDCLDSTGLGCPGNLANRVNPIDCWTGFQDSQNLQD